MAHPPGAEQLAAFEALHRQRVARKERDSQVWAEDLRHRPDDDVAFGGAVDRRVRRAGDLGDIVVLDHEDVRVLSGDRAELGRALVVDGGAGRVLSSRGDDHRSRSAFKRSAERVRHEPARIDRNRLGA